jgi:hypothetical protein
MLARNNKGDTHKVHENEIIKYDQPYSIDKIKMNFIEPKKHINIVDD